LDLFKKNIPTIIIDLLNVSNYFSKIYKSSDQYLEKYGSEVLTKYSILLKNNSEETIIKTFIDDSIEKSDKNHISWNNIHYMWKKYLNKHNLPILFTISQCKEYLKQQVKYNEEKDMFEGITSKYLPYIDNFLSFIGGSFTEGEEEWKVEEIQQLYKYWCKKNNIYTLIKEKDIFNIIEHFFPSFIVNNSICVYCELWNKTNEIKQIIQLFQKDFLLKLENKEILLPYLIPLSDFYSFYALQHSNINKEIDIIINYHSL
jgi:hypothetical protein